MYYTRYFIFVQCFVFLLHLKFCIRKANYSFLACQRLSTIDSPTVFIFSSLVVVAVTFLSPWTIKRKNRPTSGMVFSPCVFTVLLTIYQKPSQTICLRRFLVRPTGFEPAAYRVGVIRPSSHKPLWYKALVGIAQISGDL